MFRDEQIKPGHGEKPLVFHNRSYLHINHAQDMNYSLQEYIGLSV